MTLIKICGIMDPDTAFFTAQAGADMIGILQYPKSKRYVAPLKAKEIAQAAREGGAIPVAVFKDALENEILSSSILMEVNTIQLHGLMPSISREFICIFANTTHSQIRTSNDYLLVDNVNPGLGIPFDWNAFIPPTGISWILSGGLTTQNVQEGIRRFKPDGVDVSSGVELNGIKQKDLIKKFIDKVRCFEG